MEDMPKEMRLAMLLDYQRSEGTEKLVALRSLHPQLQKDVDSLLRKGLKAGAYPPEVVMGIYDNIPGHGLKKYISFESLGIPAELSERVLNGRNIDSRWDRVIEGKEYSLLGLCLAYILLEDHSVKISMALDDDDQRSVDFEKRPDKVHITDWVDYRRRGRDIPEDLHIVAKEMTGKAVSVEFYSGNARYLKRITVAPELSSRLLVIEELSSEWYQSLDIGWEGVAQLSYSEALEILLDEEEPLTTENVRNRLRAVDAVGMSKIGNQGSDSDLDLDSDQDQDLKDSVLEDIVRVLTHPIWDLPNAEEVIATVRAANPDYVPGAAMEDH